MEKVTVPAGTFDCYKLLYSNDSGPTSTEWWPANNEYPVAAKVVSENNIVTPELVSYTE